VKQNADGTVRITACQFQTHNLTGLATSVGTEFFILIVPKCAIKNLNIQKYLCVVCNADDDHQQVQR
jgi:hypothetical protein